MSININTLNDSDLAAILAVYDDYHYQEIDGDLILVVNL